MQQNAITFAIAAIAVIPASAPRADKAAEDLTKLLARPMTR